MRALIRNLIDSAQTKERPVKGFLRNEIRANLPEEKPENPAWTPRICLTLSDQSCSKCFGLGKMEGGRTLVCGCVARNVFKAVLRKYNFLSSDAAGTKSSVRYNGVSWSRKNEDFLADVVLTARRTILNHPRWEQDEKDLYIQIFRLHMLEGREWSFCARRLHINRGQFFHAVYRIQENVGRAFKETAPYALFPLDEYFSSKELPIVRPRAGNNRTLLGMPEGHKHNLVGAAFYKPVDVFYMSKEIRAARRELFYAVNQCKPA